jgi:MerR family Zn(II)-responsive transcriptional regulator of zntA
MAGDGLLIGQVADRAGTNPKTIRFYETIDLLPQPPRGQNRYRLYSKEMVDLLHFIKRAQGLGFTLSEIKEIVDLHRTGHAPCAHVRALLDRKIADLDQRLKDMAALRRKLKALRAEASEQTSPRQIEPIVCPHIEGVPLDAKPRR